MKEYTYYFVDGTKSTIEIEGKWYDILKEIDEEECKGKYNYDRHNKPISMFDQEGNAFVDSHADLFDKLLKSEQCELLNSALKKLTDCQRKLFEAYFVDRKKVTEIAEEQGVCHQAISQRLKRIKIKLQNFFATPQQKAIFETKQ